MDNYNALRAGSKVTVNGVQATVIEPSRGSTVNYADGSGGYVTVFHLLMTSGEVRLFTRDAFKWPVDAD